MKLKNVMRDLQKRYETWLAAKFYQNDARFLREYRTKLLEHEFTLKEANQETTEIKRLLNSIDEAKDMREAELRYMKNKGAMPFRYTELRKTLDILYEKETQIMKAGAYWMLPDLDNEYYSLAFHATPISIRYNETQGSGLTTGHVIKADEDGIGIYPEYPRELCDNKYASNQARISLEQSLNLVSTDKKRQDLTGLDYRHIFV
ncbi:MAG: hypothetical protein V1870_01695 [Candidatus Aenigmatarchaeota archaeon]